MCVLIFFTRFVRTLLIIRGTERVMMENVYCSSCKVPVILNQILMELKFSRQLFEKYTDIKFHENPSSGSRVLCGRIVQTDMKKLTVAFRTFTKTSKRGPKMFLFRVDLSSEANGTK